MLLSFEQLVNCRTKIGWKGNSRSELHACLITYTVWKLARVVGIVYFICQIRRLIRSRRCTLRLVLIL